MADDLKTSQETAVTVIQDTDYFRLSVDIGGGEFASRKITGANAKTAFSGSGQTQEVLTIGVDPIELDPDVDVSIVKMASLKDPATVNLPKITVDARLDKIKTIVFLAVESADISFAVDAAFVSAPTNPWLLSISASKTIRLIASGANAAASSWYLIEGGAVQTFGAAVDVGDGDINAIGSGRINATLCEATTIGASFYNKDSHPGIDGTGLTSVDVEKGIVTGGS